MVKDDVENEPVSPCSSLSSTPTLNVPDEHSAHRNDPITFPSSSSPTTRFLDTISFKARSKSPLLLFSEGAQSFASAAASNTNLLSASHTASAHGTGGINETSTPLGPTYTGYRLAPQNDPSDADDEADSPRTVRTQPRTSVSSSRDSQPGFADHGDESAEDENNQAQDQDDQGLHVQLARVRLGKHEREVSGEGAEAARETAAAAASRVVGLGGGMEDVGAGVMGLPGVDGTDATVGAEDEWRGSKRARFKEGGEEGGGYEEL